MSINTVTIPFRRFTGRIALLLLLSPLSARTQSPPLSPSTLPDNLQSALRSFQAKDDLSGWIYGQIQWVARAPANRSDRLVRAVEEAWRQPRTGEEIQAWQDLLINEGYALLLSGAIVASTDAYTSAYEWARQHREITDDGLVLENILKPLGNNYTRLGDYEQAFFIHRKALTLAIAEKDMQALAGVYSNLANTSSNMGRPEQALEFCRKGLEVVDKSSALRGLLLSEQADACLELRQMDAAKASIDHSITILQRSLARHDDPSAGYWLLMALQQAGDICASAPEKALGFYKHALDLQEKLLQQNGDIRQRERAKLLQRLGALFSRLHQERPAIHWSDQCLSVLIPGRTFATLQETDLYAENTLADLLYTRAGLSQQAGNANEALRLYRLSFIVEKKLRQERITGVAKQRGVADTRLRYEVAIGIAWEAWDRTKEKRYQQAVLDFMESSKAQLLLEEMQQQQQLNSSRSGDSLTRRIRLLEKAQVYYDKEALGSSDSIKAASAAQEKQIGWELAQLRKQATPRGASPESASPRTSPVSTIQGAPSLAYGLNQAFSLDSLPVLLGTGQAARSYFAGERALYSVECTAAGISFIERLPLSGQWQDSLREFIHTWFGQGANTMIDHPIAYARQAAAIYRQLFGQHPFQPGEEYILLTDGALNLLPVEALVTTDNCPASPGQWPFVIRQTLLSYGWSFQTLLQQQTGAGAPAGFAGFFLSGNLRSSPILQATLAEKAGIQKIIKGGNWYTDGQATAATFRSALSGSSIVHISSHAYTGKDGSDIPRIELYDEPFYLFELRSLEHHPALVVLSACRTGDGKMVTGEGVQSLARAFTAGGTDAVVAGWWNVNDETAAQLMEGFYTGLVTGQQQAQQKVNAAQALRQSKLAWLDDPNVPYLHKLPYYWGALNYQGDPRPLPATFHPDISPRSAWQLIRSGWWLLLLTLPLILTWLIKKRAQRK
jgi:tetratricopeptide (TPR) repeat protein